MNKIVTGLVSSLALIWGITGSAQAVPCSDTTSGIFTDSGFTTAAYSTCHDGGSTNDSATELNTQSVFGFTDWVYLDKTGEAGPVDIGLSITGQGDIEGEWSFNPATWSAYNFITIVLKDGGTAPDGDKWSAYLIDPAGLSSGWWRYGLDDSGSYKQISHLSVYAREGANNVSEPGMLGLLGLGLVGLGIARRRRQA